jgi:ElaB/YqjD/DUF883 family membrane-anchored ribosome-binding protein
MNDPSAESTTEQMKQQAREQTQAFQEKASGALGQVRGRLREQIDQRSTNAGEQVQSTASDVRAVAEELRRQGKDAPARMAEQMADRVESFGGYLRNADGERMLGDVERYARRQPWVLAAGGMALGFVASRFLKASSGRRYQSSGTADQFGSPAGNGAGAAAAPPVVDEIRDPAPEATWPDDQYATSRYPER